MTNEKSKILKKGSFEFNVSEKDAVFIHRQFTGKTDRDLEIERLIIPKRPLWLRLVVSLIRFYQKRLSEKLGNRCVFDPSCSHYSELAFRKKGVVKGTVLTIKRLCRCRPVNGGIDEL